jgi:uncharacterized protein (DUF302 family)
MEMKKVILTGVAGLLVGAALAVFVIFKMASGMMLIETQSPYDFETTVDRFEKAVLAKDWKIPATHNLQATMKKFGYDVQAVKVFELCHPDHAAKILKESEERIVSSMMPCRVAIYEKSNGKVYLSRMNSELMAGTMGGIVQEVMADAFSENEQIIEAALK